jgi:hypothetical protein
MNDSNETDSISPPPSEPLGTVASRKDRSFAWTLTIVFGVVILLPCLVGFVIKFRELLALTNAQEDGGFSITPVINYLLASAGFFFLLLWAALNGMFSDLERPKYLMLENERELDAHG